MPCRSEHMEPTAREEESRRVSKLLAYVYNRLAIKPSEDLPFDMTVLNDCTSNTYGNLHLLDAFVANLCSLLRSLTTEQMESIVYDGHNKQSRQLADWWENHKEIDIARIEKSAEHIKRSEAKKKKIKEKTLEIYRLRQEIRKLQRS